MEQHLKTRPKKTTLEESEQVKLREKAEQKIKDLLLPDEGIKKIKLIGSSVKGTFGEYEPPGFRGSLYSDFDFIVFVDNEYHIPDTLTRELDGKPFSDDTLNLAYREPRFVDDKYDVEIFFIRDASLRDPNVIRLGEQAGIPMNDNSQHPNLVIYSR